MVLFFKLLLWFCFYFIYIPLLAIVTVCFTGFFVHRIYKELHLGEDDFKISLKDALSWSVRTLTIAWAPIFIWVAAYQMPNSVGKYLAHIGIAVNDEAKIAALGSGASQLEQREQRIVADISARFRKLYSAASSEVEKSNLRVERRKELRAALGDKAKYIISNWTGKVSVLSTDSDGDVNNFQVSFGEFVLRLDHIIPSDSEIYKEILNTKIKAGSDVQISAVLEAQDATDFLPEGSVTEAGSMKEPEFMIYLTKIKKAAPASS